MVPARGMRRIGAFPNLDRPTHASEACGAPSPLAHSTAVQKPQENWRFVGAARECDEAPNLEPTHHRSGVRSPGALTEHTTSGKLGLCGAARNAE